MLKDTKKITLYGIFTALVFLATRLISFPGPVPPGYINLGDTMIILAAGIAGPGCALFAGAVGSGLADIAYGAMIFAPITFIVKGLEGLIIGLIIWNKGQRKSLKWRLFGASTGVLVMVAGYFIAEWQILGLFDENFGISAAISELPLNLVQASVSLICGYALMELIIKTKAVKV